jgi:WD40 repeat protein
MTLIFVNETIVSAGNDGFLYVWDMNRIVKMQNAHPKSQILTLATTLGSNMFISGGKDGKVIIWVNYKKYSKYLKEKKLFIYSH